MNLIRSSTPNKWGGGNTCREIIIHWWDDPSKKPTLRGVVSMFQNPTYEIAAHYVVSGADVVQMCEETDRPWHAVAANGFGIGIEVDPNTPGNTYKTVGELVRNIRARHGNIPLKRHSDYVNTRCPGGLDIARIEREAAGNVLGSNTGDDMYEGKTAKQWADDYKSALSVATTREDYLNRVSLAAGEDIDPVNEDDVNRMIANIDAKNKLIKELETDPDKAVKLLQTLKEALKEE